MQSMMTVLSDPDFWTKPRTGGWAGLAVGGVVGFLLSLYFVPPSQHSYSRGSLLGALIWMPCMLIGMLIGQLVAVWMGR